MTSHQLAIALLVQKYIDENHQEFDAFKEQNEMRKNIQQNVFSEIKNTNYILRQYAEYPETLHNLLHDMLSAGEYQWFRSKKGQEWFLKKYPFFSVNEKL